MLKVTKSLGLALIAGMIFTLSAGLNSDAEAGKSKRIYSLTEIVDRLKDRGFYGIRVTDRSPPFYDMYVCYQGKRFELTIDHKGNIRDKDREGNCRVKKKFTELDEEPLDLKTPYSSVEIDRDRDVRVEAPYVDVEVSERDGVRVRAPFVDIWVR